MGRVASRLLASCVQPTSTLTLLFPTLNLDGILAGGRSIGGLLRFGIAYVIRVQKSLRDRSLNEHSAIERQRLARGCAVHFTEHHSGIGRLSRAQQRQIILPIEYSQA